MKCLNCNIASKNPKFCSHHCSALYNNSLINQWKKYMTWTKARTPKICRGCGCQWIDIAGFNKRDWNKTNVCSDECKKRGRTFTKEESSKGGRKSSLIRIQRSKKEIELYNLCINHFKNVDHNINLSNGWDADIIIHDIKIAILWNGPWHYREMKGLNHSLIQVQIRDKIKIKELSAVGWNVKVFEDRFYTPNSAFQELLYATKSSASSQTDAPQGIGFSLS